MIKDIIDTNSNAGGSHEAFCPMNSLLREFIGDNPQLYPLVRKLFVFKGTTIHPRQIMAAPRMSRTWNVLTQLLALTALNPQLR